MYTSRRNQQNTVILTDTVNHDRTRRQNDKKKHNTINMVKPVDIYQSANIT